MLSFLVIVTVFLIIFYRVLSKGYRYYGQFPGPYIYPILGNFLDIIGTDQSKVFRLMRRCSAKYGTFRLWAIGTGHIHTSRTREAEILLSSTKHSNKSEIYRFLMDFLGTGLLISNGEKWQQRRKILTPAFHFNILQKFTPIFNEESVNVVKMIQGEMHGGTSCVLDIAKISCRLTLNVICETAMGVKLDSIKNADSYRRNLYKVTEIVLYRVMRPWLYIDGLFRVLGYQRKVDKYVGIIKEFTQNIINKRRLVFQEKQRQLQADDGQVEVKSENV